jgi:hypothetical protein
MRILKRRRAVAVVHETPRVDPRTT